MSDPIIRAAGIVKDYALGRTTLRVLRGVDVQIEAGQFVAIVGSSGSGKSTLLHIMGALDIPQRGQVWFRGQAMFEPEPQRRFPDHAEVEPVAATPGSAPAAQPVHGLTYSHERPRMTAGSLEQFRNQLRNTAIGFVFQFYHLLPEFDVVENVMMPAVVGHGLARWSDEHATIRERAVELLNQMDLGHRLGHRPNELSGGERQRAAIARALMNRPQVLLADEPTGNLDTRTGAEILERLRALHAAGQTIVMVTHDHEIARRADRTIRLVDGRAV